MVDNQNEYSLVTESPGLQATKEQIERIYQRYNFAREFAHGRDVLEIGCGSGMGLEHLAKVAKKVMGGDIDEDNISLAQKIHVDNEKIDIHLMDAHDIKLPDRSVDLAILFEAIYYLHTPEKFLKEAYRILRENGKIIICTVNKDWEDFHPSPYTHRYFSVPELHDLIKEDFKNIKIYGAFPVANGGVRGKILSFIKKTALKFNLIPGSLKARALLKRIFIGKVQPLPEKIEDGMAVYEKPCEISPVDVNKDYKIIYTIASK